MKGSSGATLVINKGEVIKAVPLSDFNQYTHLKEQYCYMKYLSSQGLTPEVKECGYGSTDFYYIMDYVPTAREKKCPVHMRAIAQKFRYLGYAIPDVKFEAYIDRMKQHIKYLSKFPIFRKMMTTKYFYVNGNEVPNIDFFNYFKIMDKEYAHLRPTLCHGDLTYENTVGNLVIDTNYLMDGWNHYYIDFGKIAQSCHYDYEGSFSDDSEIDIKENSMIDLKTKVNKKDFDFYDITFEISHYLRMLKYKLAESDNKFKLAYIRMCQCYQDLWS